MRAARVDGGPSARGVRRVVAAGPAKEGGDQVKAAQDFIASLISDPVMRERVLYVFSALPEGVQEEFMGDPGFVIDRKSVV